MHNAVVNSRINRRIGWDIGNPCWEVNFFFLSRREEFEQERERILKMINPSPSAKPVSKLRKGVNLNTADDTEYTDETLSPEPPRRTDPLRSRDSAARVEAGRRGTAVARPAPQRSALECADLSALSAGDLSPSNSRSRVFSGPLDAALPGGQEPLKGSGLNKGNDLQ